MNHVGWESNSMALYYLKLAQVLRPGGLSDILASQDEDSISLFPNYTDLNSLKILFRPYPLLPSLARLSVIPLLSERTCYFLIFVSPLMHVILFWDSCLVLGFMLFFWGGGGVGANLGPFSRRDRSAAVRGFLDRLTTQLLLSKEFGDGLNSFCSLPSLLACLVSILLRTAWPLLFKKFLRVKRLSAETKGVNSLSVSWMARFLALIWSWQMEILAFIQCMLARSIMRLKMGCLPGG